MSYDARTAHPGLGDFYHDMNQHGSADYWKVGGPFVVEVQRFGHGGAWLTVWRAVDHPSRKGYVAPDDATGNRFAWDAVGRKEYDDADEARGRAVSFGASKGKVRAFCEANPYDGPRSPWAEKRARADA